MREGEGRDTATQAEQSARRGVRVGAGKHARAQSTACRKQRFRRACKLPSSCPRRRLPATANFVASGVMVVVEGTSPRGAVRGRADVFCCIRSTLLPARPRHPQRVACAYTYTLIHTGAYLLVSSQGRGLGSHARKGPPSPKWYVHASVRGMCVRGRDTHAGPGPLACARVWWI